GHVGGIELVRVDRPRQFLRELFQVVFRRADHRMADHDAELAVDAPMDEQPESLVAKPLEPLGAIGERRRARGESEEQQNGCKHTQGRLSSPVNPQTGMSAPQPAAHFATSFNSTLRSRISSPPLISSAATLISNAPGFSDTR